MISTAVENTSTEYVRTLKINTSDKLLIFSTLSKENPRKIRSNNLCVHQCIHTTTVMGRKTSSLV